MNMELGHVVDLTIEQISNPADWVPRLIQIPGLITLTVADEEISGELLAGVSLTGIRRIYLHWIHYEADAALRYVSQMRGIEYVELFASFVSDAGLAHLANHDTLAGLTIDTIPISRKGWDHIGRMRSLRELCVRYSFGPPRLSVLAGLEKMKELQFAHTDIGDKIDWESLRSLRQLEALFLEDCHFLDGDRAVPGLGTLDQVRIMRLWNAHLTKRGLNRLRKLLPDCAFEYLELPTLIEPEFFPPLSGRGCEDDEDIPPEVLTQRSKELLEVLRALWGDSCDDESWRELIDDEQSGEKRRKGRSWWSRLMRRWSLR